MEIVRKKLTADELTPRNIRFDGIGYQQTFDGGATWADAPGLDPRTSDAYRAPALATADPQCDAAANMVAALRQMVDALGHETSTVGIGSLMFGIFFFFVPFGWIADVILLVVEGIIVVGITPFIDAMTEDVYGQFLCIFYCNIDADGQMSQSQLDDIYVAVSEQFDATIQGGFGSLSGGFGPVGWSNAGALGTEMGDCTDCECAWCYLWNFAVSDGGWLVGAQGTWDGTKWLSQNTAPATYDILIYTECAGGCGLPIETIICDAEWFPGASVEDAYIAVFDRDGGGYHSMAALQTMTPGRATYTFDVSAYGSVNSLAVNTGNNNDVAGSVALYSTQAQGTGTQPSFTSGADCS